MVLPKNNRQKRSTDGDARVKHIQSHAAVKSWHTLPYRQTISFIEISIEAGILLGGKHEACFVLGGGRN